MLWDSAIPALLLIVIRLCGYAAIAGGSRSPARARWYLRWWLYLMRYHEGVYAYFIGSEFVRCSSSSTVKA